MTKFLAVRKPLIIAAVLALAAALRFAYLGSFSYFIDEIHAMNFTRGPLAGSMRILAETPGTAPLDYALVNILSHISVSEWFMRLPYAAAGVLSVWFTFRVARRSLGDKRAIISAALVAASTAHIYYSQSIRCYSISVLLLLMIVDAFEGVCNDGGARAAVRFAGLSAVAALNQFFMIIPVGILIGFASAAMYIGRGRKDTNRKAKLIAIAAGAFATGSVFILNWNLIMAPKSLGVLSEPEPLWLLIVQALRAFTMFASLGKPALGAIVFVLFLIGLVSMLFAAPRFTGLVFAVAILPVPVIIFQEIRLKSGVHLRHLVYALPFYMMAASVGIGAVSSWLAREGRRLSLRRLFRASRLAPQTWEFVICILLAAAMLQSVMLYYSEPYRFNGGEADLRPDLKTPAERLAQYTTENDCLVAAGIAAGPWMYGVEKYLLDMGRNRRIIQFAALGDDAARSFSGGCDVKFIFFDFPYYYTRGFENTTSYFKIRKLNDFAYLMEPAEPVRDADKLIEAAEKFAYLTMPPSDFGIFSQAYTNIGIAARMKGGAGLAEAAQEKAVRGAKRSLFKNVFDEIEAREQLGRTLMRAGDDIGAYDQFKAAEALVPRRMSRALAAQLGYRPEVLYSLLSETAGRIGIEKEKILYSGIAKEYADSAAAVDRVLRIGKGQTTGR